MKKSFGNIKSQDKPTQPVGTIDTKNSKILAKLVRGIQDVPTFYRPTGKTKVLNYSFNQFVYNFYPQSILILKEYLLK